MPDDDEGKEEPKKEEKKEEVKPLPDLDKITPKHLHDLEEKIRSELSEGRVKDAEEKAELRAQLDELREFKTQQEKAQEDRDKVKDSQHTMVLPPNDIPPQQPTPPPTQHDTPGGKKTPFWKKAW